MMQSFVAELRALEAGEVFTYQGQVAVRGLVTVLMDEVAKHLPDADPADHLAAMLSTDVNELHISLVAKTAEGQRVLDLLGNT